MPSIEHNRHVWDRAYDWPDAGEEWSRPWGGTESLWEGALYPRIRSLLPARTVLEIAPGHGRFTGYLRDSCERLIAVDLSPHCIEACRQRFSGRSGIEYHVNDGTSLDMIEDESIDLVFSFDSLVHAEAAVLKAYVSALGRKLSPSGKGFIHHSNLGGYRLLAALTERTPEPVRRLLVERGVLVNTYAWRSRSVTAARVREWCQGAGLHCVSQELVNWTHGRYLIDGLTTFTRQKGPATCVVKNPGFMDEARRLRAVRGAHDFDPRAQR